MAGEQDGKYGRYRESFGWEDDLKSNGLTLPGETDGANYKAGSYIHRLMKGITLADSASIKGFTPFITGRNLFIVTKMPKFMEVVTPSTTALFRHLTQFYTKSITGFQDLQLGTTTIDNGIEAAGIDVATSISGATKDITIEYGPEVRGLFIHKYIRAWMSGIIDPLSNVGTYLGAFDLEEGKDLDWDIANHTMEGIQIVMDPTRRKIEGQALIVGMQPKNAPGNYLDTTQGQHDFITPQIQYSCTVYPNLADIDEILASIDILGYIKTARYNTVSMAHTLDKARQDEITGEVAKIKNSFNVTTGRQVVQTS